MSNLTFMFDYFAGPLIYSISSWKMCENFLLKFDFLKQSELIDANTLDFDESNPKVTLFRVIFFLVLIVINFPFIIKKRIDSLRKLSFISVLSILFIVFIVLYQLPYYYYEFKEKNELVV